jgi:hypothetical protein
MTSARRNDLSEDVVGWLRDYLQLPTSMTLMPETSVNLDLGVDGDDGAEFLDAFAKRFAVDITSFAHARYFGPEAGASPISFLRRIATIAGLRDAQALDPLCIKDLVELANR